MLSVLHIASDKSDIHRNEVSMIRIGTRKSKLALIQTELVKAQILKYFPNEKIEIVHVVTHGDKVLDKPLGEIGGKGVFTKEIEEEAKKLQKEFMPEDTNAGIIQAFLDDYEDDYVCTKLLFDDALHRTGEMKQWESKEIANIMNNAIEGWKQHGTHRFGKEYGIQRSWKRIEGIEKKDKDGFMEVPEQLEIPFE